MKNLNLTHFKFIFSALLLAASTAANAQSLPAKQTVSLRAPAEIKIDGKATEWGDKLQAYNRATDVYYTIANDDEMLYLTLQTKYHDVVANILSGGITLTINHTADKKDMQPIGITYPILRNTDMILMENMFLSKANKRRDNPDLGVYVDDLNKLMDAKSKLIIVTGIKSIPDSAISVYNTDNIRAMGQFDAMAAYTYELAIPLKYLSLPDNGNKAFSYHIKINEPVGITRIAVTGMAPGSNTPPPPPPPAAMESLSSTDFWGTYTLAKK